jgi:hypothetical protein
MKISKTQRLSDAIVRLFKSHPLPFTLIESLHFQELFKILETNIPIANRVTLANRILDQGNEMQERIKELLASEEVLNIHLSTDLWHSPGDRSHYIAVIIGFVDRKFEFNEILLTFAKFNIQHTGANLANGLFSLIEEYQVLNKLTGVTTDGAANNLSMMNELERLYEDYKLEHGTDSITGLASLFTSNDWAHSLSHILHLLVTTTLRSYMEFQEVLPKVRKVASIIRLSDTYRDKFEEICNHWNMRFSRPPGEVQTRWNSSYELLNWCVTFKDPLNVFLRDNYVNANEKIKEQLRALGSTTPFGEILPSYIDLSLSKSDWNLVILMRGILEKFYRFTCRFNKSQSMSSDALNTLFYIDESLKDIKESETAEQAKLLFERHKIKSTIAIIPEGLRKAVDVACGKLENTSLMLIVWTQCT